MTKSIFEKELRGKEKYLGTGSHTEDCIYKKINVNSARQKAVKELLDRLIVQYNYEELLNDAGANPILSQRIVVRELIPHLLKSINECFGEVEK